MRIFLTGVSCVGKTTIGSELAAQLHVPFFDVDSEIETFFQKPIARLQAETLTIQSYRRKAATALESLLAREESRRCVVALPPSGLMNEYWRVVRTAGAMLVVLEDEPENILARIAFYDGDSCPVTKELSPVQARRYLRQIKSDVTYFRRSYAKAHLTVHLGGRGVRESAEKVRAAVEAHLKKVGTEGRATRSAASQAEQIR
jgi:shikimate kinase